VPVIRTPHQTPKGCCDPALAVQERLTTVRSTLIGPDGRPLAGREVMAVLRAAPSWLGDGTGRVVETARTRTDRNGEWMLPLLPNRYLEPPTNESGTPVPTSYYEISEGGLVSTALVPAAGEHTECPQEGQQCVVWLRDILIDGPQPGPVPWRPIANLGDLHNVTPQADTSAQQGQALLYNGRVWEPGPVASRLEALEDVTTPDGGPEPGQALIYQDHAWQPGPVATSLDNLSDVDTTLPPEEGQALVYNGRVWHPGALVGALASMTDVDTPADSLVPGFALIYNGRVWEPGPVASRLEDLGDVNTTTPPEEGQALIYQDQQWSPATLRAALAMLTDMHPSIAAAEPGDTLTAIERDPDTGRLLWGVDRQVPHLEVHFGGRAGSMQVQAEVVSPDVTTNDVQIHWEGTPDGPTSTLIAGVDYTAAHTYTQAGTYPVQYRYTDGSAAGAETITVPLQARIPRRG